MALRNCLTLFICVTHYALRCFLRELKNGVPVADDSGKVYGNSVNAAQQGIAQVTMSRIFMACPGEIIVMILLKLFSYKIKIFQAWS